MCEDEESFEHIDDHPFKLSYMHYDPQSYYSQLEIKTKSILEQIFATRVNSLMTDLDNLRIDMISSPHSFFRQRVRFAITQLENSGLVYVMWEEGEPKVKINRFPLASTDVFDLMPYLICYLNFSRTLTDGLKSIHFHGTLSREVMISFIYAESLDEEVWLDHAQKLQQKISLFFGLPCEAIKIIGRSKGLKVVLTNDFVCEEFILGDGRIVKYRQVEDGFSNPNAVVNIQCLDWLCSVFSFVSSYFRQNLCNRSKANTNKISPVEFYPGEDSHVDAVLVGNGFKLHFRYADQSHPNPKLRQGDERSNLRIGSYCVLQRSPVILELKDSGSSGSNNTMEQGTAVESVVDIKVSKDSDTPHTASSSALGNETVQSAYNTSPQIPLVDSNASPTNNALATTEPSFDLLELYCGNGNHTVAIAGECHNPLIIFLGLAYTSLFHDLPFAFSFMSKLQLYHRTSSVLLPLGPFVRLL